MACATVFWWHISGHAAKSWELSEPRTSAFEGLVRVVQHFIVIMRNLMYSTLLACCIGLRAPKYILEQVGVRTRIQSSSARSPKKEGRTERWPPH